MSRSKAGLTLIELLIASMIAMIVLSLAVALYRTTEGRFVSVTESYELEHHVSELVAWLSEDLSQTSIGSVVVYPNHDQAKEPPGLSLVSADAPGEFKNLSLTAYGTPNWQKHVFYTLSPRKKHPGMSRLVRYEMPHSGLPSPSVHLPSSFSDVASTRDVSKQLLSKGFSFKAGQAGLMEPLADPDSPGGFLPSFLKSDGSSTTKNPSLASSNAIKDNTPIIQVHLVLAEVSADGKWNSQDFRFRVRPKN